MSFAQPLLLALVLAMSSERPALEPCPRTPNCVSTQAADPAKRMDPIPFRGDLAASRGRLLEILESLPRVSIEQSLDTSIHAVFTTPLISSVSAHSTASSRRSQPRSKFHLPAKHGFDSKPGRELLWDEHGNARQT